MPERELEIMRDKEREGRERACERERKPESERDKKRERGSRRER